MQMPQVQAPTLSEQQGTGGPGEAMRFEGFDPPESNFWRLPNNWFDLAARFTSWAEHKVVEYILRHTWGYHEYGVAKLITMDEFMHGRKRRDGSRLDAGCGMAENSIKKGIADAVAHGFLIVQTDDSDRGRIKKFYAPRMRRPLVDEGAHAINPGGQSLMGQGQFLTPRPQPLTPERQDLTLQAPDLIPTAQPLIPSRPVADPRTEETPRETHPVQETRSKNNPVVALPAQEKAGSRSGDAHRTGQAAVEQPGSIPPGAPAQSTMCQARRRRKVRDRAGLHAARHVTSRASSADAATSHTRREAVEPLKSPLPLRGVPRREERLAAETVRAAQPRVVAEAPPAPDLVERLVGEGIGAAKARALAAAFPAERIARQLAWIDGRSYRDRAATLVASIEGDFGAPPTQRRAHGVEAAGFDRGKYYRGSYALCPRCGGRPCAPGCDADSASAVRRG